MGNVILKLKLFLHNTDSCNLFSRNFLPPFIHFFFLLFPYILFLVSILFRIFEPLKQGEVFGTSFLLFTILSGSYIRISYYPIKCSHKNFASTSGMNLKTELETLRIIKYIKISSVQTIKAMLVIKH